MTEIGLRHTGFRLHQKICSSWPCHCTQYLRFGLEGTVNHIIFKFRSVSIQNDPCLKSQAFSSSQLISAFSGCLYTLAAAGLFHHPPLLKLCWEQLLRASVLLYKGQAGSTDCTQPCYSSHITMASVHHTEAAKEKKLTCKDVFNFPHFHSLLTLQQQLSQHRNIDKRD